MEDSLFEKILVCGIIILFVGAGVLTSMGEVTGDPNSLGDVFYCDANGDGTLPMELKNPEITSTTIETSSLLSSPYSILLSETTFDLIGTLDICNGGTVAAYDTNHNGFMEIIYEKKLSGVYPAIFYENRNGVFTLVHTLGVYGPVWDVGDFDGDGKSDLITQYVSEVRIYESSDENSYPSNLVWSAPLLGNIWCFATGGFDLDKDGEQEIVVANNFGWGTHTVRIYENDGDNVYTLVFETPVIDGHQVGVVAGDFDNDGKMEFLASNAAPEIIIYENGGDDSYHEARRIDYGYLNNGRSCIGPDLDEDGLPEIILGGECLLDCIDYITIIEKSNDDDTYTVTAEIEGPYDNACGTLYRPITGNVMGNASSELVIGGYRDWYIYRSIADNQYEEIYSHGESSNINGQLFLVDTNNNSYQEIIIASDYVGSTRVYEIRSSICGDVNNDRQVDVGDVVYLINYLYKSGPAPRPMLCVGDCNGDGTVDIGDVMYLINYLFRAEPEPIEGCCG